MAKLKQDFTMISGDTKFIKVIITLPQREDTLNGTTVRWGLFTREEKQKIVEKIYEPAGEQDGIQIFPDSNSILIKIDSQDTQNLIGRFFHEVEITDVLGNISTVTQGTVTINEDLLKPRE